MRATVLVRPKAGILDPQGQAVESSLQHLGFAVDGTQGRPARRARARDERRRRGSRPGRADVRAAAREPADRELRDRAPPRRMSAVATEPRPRIAVVVFPGSNDDRDAELALERLGADAVRVWHTEPELPAGTAAVVLPGGFSYGDYLRCGAIARFSPVMAAVVRFADEGGLVLGICNGFQILTEAGLLPGALRPNESLSFVCRDVALDRRAVPTRRSPSRCEAEQRLTIPVKHGDGCWFADAGDARGARGGRTDPPPLRAGREPERRRRRRRGRLQRARKRVRPDAAPRARGRPAARLDRRRADPRLARRRRSIVGRGARLGTTSRQPERRREAGLLCEPRSGRARGRAPSA